MNTSLFLASLVIAAAATLPHSASAVEPPDVRTHPADPPDNRMPPPVQTPPQPVESERSRPAPTNTFDMLDTNRDGFLTRIEFSATDKMASADFDRFDSNRDGKLSKEEWLRSQSPLVQDKPTR